MRPTTLLPIRTALVRLARDEPSLRPVLLPLTRQAAGWNKLPKGWTQESVEKFWGKLTGKSKHKVTECIKRMEDKFDNPGAFCGSLKDQVDGSTDWRKGPRGKKANGDMLQYFADNPDKLKEKLERDKMKTERNKTSAEDVDDCAKAEAWLDANFIKVTPRKWMHPTKNVGVNMTLMGSMNFWGFTPLKLLWRRNRGQVFWTPNPKYDEGRGPGMILRPSWQSLSRNNYPCRLQNVEMLPQIAAKLGTYADTVKKQFAEAEALYGVKIPSAIKTKWMAGAFKIAKRRFKAKNSVNYQGVFVSFGGEKDVGMGTYGPKFKAARLLAGRYLLKRGFTSKNAARRLHRHASTGRHKTARAENPAWFAGELEKVLQILQDAVDVADHSDGTHEGLSTWNGAVADASNDIRRNISRGLANHAKAVRRTR